MWPGIWLRWPGSGDSVASASAESMAASGVFAISMAWLCKCTTAGRCGLPCSFDADRAFARLDRLHHIRPPRRRARLDVPQAPRGTRDQRLDVESHDVMIVGVVVVDPSHLRCVVVVPAIEFLQRHRMRLLEPARQRLDQLVLEVGGAVRKGTRLDDVVPGEPG